MCTGKYQGFFEFNMSNRMTFPFYVLDPITGAPIISDPLDSRRLPQHINTNHNLMLHEQLFPAANRITGYIIPEVALDRLSRYGIRFFT